MRIGVGNHISESDHLRYVDGELDETEVGIIEDHLATCTECRDFNDDLAAASDGLTAFLKRADFEPRALSYTPRVAGGWWNSPIAKAAALVGLLAGVVGPVAFFAWEGDRTPLDGVAPVVGGVAADPSGSGSGDLSHDRARMLLDQHLTDVAPRASDLVKREIRVDAIIRPDEYSRDVRFRMSSEFADSSGAAVADTATGLIAHFQRSDKGWTLVRYGESLIPVMVDLVVQGAYRSYQDLAELNQQIGQAYELWGEEIDAKMARETDRSAALRLFDRRKVGPDPATFSALVESLEVTVSADYEWGYEYSGTWPISPVVWVASAADTAAICAAPQGRSPGRLPASFSWIEGRGITCKGRGRVYSVEQYKTVEEEIRSKGVLVP